MTTTNIFTSLELKRPNTNPKLPLRAFSAADEYVLDALSQRELGRTLVLNDTFGAICVALAALGQPLTAKARSLGQRAAGGISGGAAEIVLWTDSQRSRNALKKNLELNGFSPETIEIVRGDKKPEGHFETVIVSVPKSLELLDYQLAAVTAVIGPESTVIATAMARHITRSTVETFSKYLGNYRCSLTRKKARLIQSENETLQIAKIDILPTESPVSYTSEHGINVYDVPGIFSTGRLDKATRLLIEHSLEHLGTQGGPTATEADAKPVIVDLGTGSGVIAATLAQRLPAHYVLADVSDLAIEAAKRCWQTNIDTDLHNCSSEFVVSDGLSGLEDASVDLVITNPPFHQDHTLDRPLTQYVIQEAHRVLKPSGQLIAVAPRQIKLHHILSRYFDNVEPLSKHPEFVVSLAN